MIYQIVSLICIACIAALALGGALAIFTRKRHRRLSFIQSFKSGVFTLIYPIGIPLYWIGLIYAGGKPFESLFSAIHKGIGLIGLDYDTESVSALMESEPIYSFALYFCFVAVTLNTLLFALSFLHMQIWACIERNRWRFDKNDKLLIVGNNEENLAIYASEKKRSAIVVDELSREAKSELYGKKVRFVSKSKDVSSLKGEEALYSGIERYCRAVLTRYLTKSKKSCVIVINTKDDDANVALCHKLIDCTRDIFVGRDPSEIAATLARVKIYVFGLPAHETVYNRLAASSNGCVRYVNKYRRIAIDFIDRFPLTQFMTEEQIDYGSSCLRDGVRVNVAMIGFGKTNEQIFLTSVANNQFVAEKEGRIALSPVNYYIFDKLHLDNDKNLNHSCYRFRNEFALSEEGGEDPRYLPLPELPSKEYYDRLDINDSSFYDKLRGALSGDGAYNYVVIGFGSDLENIDMAHKIIEKKLEWGLRDTYVFVKVRSGDDMHEIFARDDCFLIGDESRAVYNMEQIDNDRLTGMAKMRNRIYSLEYEIASNGGALSDAEVKKVCDQADCDWYIKKTQFERESNIYACLSLRSKLQLMGFDYQPITEENKNAAVSEADYCGAYAAGDKIEYHKDLMVEDKKVVKYGVDFKPSRRKTMAIHEHLRWNSFMITKGFVPSSKEEILASNNGKNYALRRHGNLTTFEGLEEFRRMIARRDGKKELETDVIKYDYQLLDDAHWLLSKNDRQIVRRSK